MSFDLLKPNCIIRFLETITCNSIHSLCYNCAIIIESLRSTEVKAIFDDGKNIFSNLKGNYIKKLE
ncbi:hypothetical protein BpHYR1_028683 [Brachionus plicatilis]|uniref:Uncharacterized protein n=1 Tax=Brachionus plicatilis TaxID=10195 RepID=A0A3M7TA76_BRAPC|nr:hypothetical protein BpHYR1_028683 [Brachionus plicatilis]